MRRTWRFLSFIFLAICFAILIFDFAQFILSVGQAAYLTTGDFLPTAVANRISAWAMVEGSTWGNINRLVLSPLINATPLWGVSLVFALIFWALWHRTV